jgi:hypothetical protein
LLFTYYVNCIGKFAAIFNKIRSSVMRDINVNELVLVSGGTGQYFSDAFLAGMKGESYPYGSISIAMGIGGILGGIVGAINVVGGAYNPGAILVFGGIGAIIGGVGQSIVVSEAAHQYQMGANYMEAMKIVNGN